MPSKIRDVENKYPAFSIIVNLLYFNQKKDKAKVKISQIVRNVFDTEKVTKTDEQTVRNIIESISKFGVKYNIKQKEPYKILSKKKKIADTVVNEDELVKYLFKLVGKYFITGIDPDFYHKIRITKPNIVKKIIKLYLKYMSSEPKEVNEMRFSDAIKDMELTIFFASTHEEVMSKISNQDLKDLIKEWSEEIGKTMDSAFAEKPPFVE